MIGFVCSGNNVAIKQLHSMHSRDEILKARCMCIDSFEYAQPWKQEADMMARVGYHACIVPLRECMALWCCRVL